MRRRAKANILKGIFLSFLLISLILIFKTVLGTVNFNALSLSAFFYLVGRLCGLMGFLFLSILIISGETARFFDRFFGINGIIMFQRKFSLITSLFILFHPLFFILSGRIYSYYLIVPNFTILPLALGTISFYLFITVMIASKIAKRISYKSWQFLHILIYFLFFFSLYHALTFGSDTGSFSISSIFYLLMMAVIIGIIYRSYYKIKQKFFSEKFYVKEVKKETEDTFTLALQSKEKLSFQPGQFCFLRINKNKLYARHPFTISSPPKEKELKFTIKIEGRFTQEASRLKEGEEVIVEGPFGIFTREDEEKDLVFIAGGVGITPFRSMIKHQVNEKSKQKISLLYGSKTKEDIIFKRELDRMDEEWFRKVYILSKEKADKDGYERGFVDKSIIEKYVKNLSNSNFYICGPEGMKEKVKKALISLGVKKRDIFIEDFFW